MRSDMRFSLCLSIACVLMACHDSYSDSPPAIVLWVNVDGTNHTCRVTGAGNGLNTNYVEYIHRSASIDSDMPLHVSISTNATLAYVIELMSIARSKGISNITFMMQSEPASTNIWDPPYFREIQIGTPHRINTLGLEYWDWKAVQKRVQQAGAGYPPQGVGYPDP